MTPSSKSPLAPLFGGLLAAVSIAVAGWALTKPDAWAFAVGVLGGTLFLNGTIVMVIEQRVGVK